jgi:Protein of unknown function (DUF3040)
MGMLSEREEQQFADIERGLATDYPDLPLVMAGVRSPVRLHRAMWSLLAVAWVACTVLAVVMGSWQSGIAPGVVTLVAAAIAIRARHRRRHRSSIEFPR